MGAKRNEVGFWWELRKKRGNYENLDVGGRMIRKWILEKLYVGIWSEFIWLRIETSGGLLLHGNEPSGFIQC
jgi:hypothetical protein